jgi:hypothetical protein
MAIRPESKSKFGLLFASESVTQNHMIVHSRSTVIQAATIQMEDWEERYPENRYAVLWKAKDEENRYSARSLQDAEEYYDYRCLLAGQKRI